MVADIASHLAYYEKYIFSFSSNIIYLANGYLSAPEPVAKNPDGV
jgi:hypothetical protein